MIPSQTPYKIVLVVLALLVITILWITDETSTNNLIYEVDTVKTIQWFETAYLYWYLHIFTLVPILCLSFDRRVHFYTRWRHLFPAILIVGLLFIGWDVFFTIKEVWGFNPQYFTQLKMAGLPLEEWMFFASVPFACVFIYECLNHYIKKDLLASIDRPLTISLIGIFFIVGVLHFDRIYTATTFLLSAFALLYHLLFIHKPYRSRFYLAYLVSLIPFLLFNGVLTGAYTKNPVVIYNPEEYLGIRITSVPLDDSIYGFLLILGVISFYEYFRSDTSSPA